MKLLIEHDGELYHVDGCEDIERFNLDKPIARALVADAIRDRIPLIASWATTRTFDLDISDCPGLSDHEVRLARAARKSPD